MLRLRVMRQKSGVVLAWPNVAPRSLIVYLALLGTTTIVAAIYPMRTVSRLPISSTLRTEVIG